MKHDYEYLKHWLSAPMRPWKVWEWHWMTARSWSGARWSPPREESPGVVILWSPSLTITGGARCWRLSSSYFWNISITSLPRLSRWFWKKKHFFFDFILIFLFLLVLFQTILLFQISGFAILIDRRNGSWQELQSVFHKIVSLFPGTIKEVFLLYTYPSGIQG